MINIVHYCTLIIIIAFCNINYIIILENKQKMYYSDEGLMSETSVFSNHSTVYNLSLYNYNCEKMYMILLWSVLDQ